MLTDLSMSRGMCRVLHPVVLAFLALLLAHLLGLPRWIPARIGPMRQNLQ